MDAMAKLAESGNVSLAGEYWLRFAEGETVASIVNATGQHRSTVMDYLGRGVRQYIPSLKKVVGAEGRVTQKNGKKRALNLTELEAIKDLYLKGDLGKDEVVVRDPSGDSPSKTPSASTKEPSVSDKVSDASIVKTYRYGGEDMYLLKDGTTVKVGEYVKPSKKPTVKVHKIKPKATVDGPSKDSTGSLSLDAAIKIVTNHGGKVSF